jgi:hypothetical protein
MALLFGCVTPIPYDYSALTQYQPRSIVIIPPLNNSIDVNASYIYLSTLSKPLAEKGYYVFPVSVIDQFLKQNGLPTPNEMNNIPLDKIREHIGADAVLYVTIDDWGQKYQVLSSNSVIRATLKLVDTQTGTLLWQTTVAGTTASQNGQNGIIASLIIAIATQIATSSDDSTAKLARKTNHSVINNSANGLLDGPYKLSNINKQEL